MQTLYADGFSQIFNSSKRLGLLGGYLSNSPLIMELTNIYWVASMTWIPATTLEAAYVMIKVLDTDTTVGEFRTQSVPLIIIAV